MRRAVFVAFVAAAVAAAVAAPFVAGGCANGPIGPHDPDPQAVLHNNRGKALYEAGQYQEAIKEFELALHKDPFYAQCEVNLAYACRAMGFHDRAIKEAENALANNPDLPDGHRVLGLIYLDRRQFDKAEAEFKAALELVEWGEAYYNLGYLYMIQGRNDEALAAFESGARVDPTHVKCLNSAGHLLWKNKLLDDAEKKFKLALDTEPHNYETNYGLAHVYFDKEEHDPAIPHCITAIKTEPQGMAKAKALLPKICEKAPKRLATVWFESAKKKSEEAAGQKPELYDQALEELYVASLIDPIRIDVKILQANILIVRGDLATAETIIQGGIALDAKNAEVLYTYATIYAARKDWKKAEDFARRSVKSDPSDAKGQNQLGAIYYEQKDYRKAARHFKKALELNPEDEFAKRNHANILRQPAYMKADEENGEGVRLLRAGDFVKAQERFEGAYELDDQFAEAISNWALCLIEKGDIKGARAKVDEALKIDSDLGPAHDLLGIIFLREGKRGDAAKEFAEAARLMPNEADPLCNLGFMYLEQKDHARAEKQFDLAMQTDPNHYKSILGRGQLFRERQLYDKAERNLKYAINLKSNLVPARLELARVYLDQKRFNDAAAALDEASKLDPENPDVWVTQAHAQLAMQQQTEAAENFLRAATVYLTYEDYVKAVGALGEATRLMPGDSNAHTDYGLGLTMVGELDEAVTVLRKAIGLDPQNVKAYWYLGNAYDQKGDCPRTIDAYEKGLVVNQDSWPILESLGSLYGKCPEMTKDKAIRHLRRALPLEPDADKKKLIRESLKKLEGK